jgi:hypothetical protein
VTAGGHLRSRCRHCIVTYQTDSLSKDTINTTETQNMWDLERVYGLRF